MSIVSVEDFIAKRADFARAIYKLGQEHEREECAKACENERVEDTGCVDDVAYNMATEDCADAIRARKE